MRARSDPPRPTGSTPAGAPRHRPWKAELVRKLIHMAMVVLPAWIVWAPAGARSRGLFLALVVLVGADVLRSVWTPWASWIEARSRPYRRPHETRFWVGVHAMVLSAWILSWSVETDIAVASLCYGIFGDAAAALVGMRTACFLVCCGIGVAVWPGDALRIVVGASVATACERWSGRVDDNLTMPLGSALALALLS